MARRYAYAAVILGFLLLLVSLLPASFGFSQRVGCTERCNVILIVVDTLAAGHIGAYGYERDTFPKTTAFFEDGVVFTEASANSPWTLPSFTSLYFSDLATSVTYKELDGGRANLVSELREAGYAIRAVTPPATVFIFDAITRPYQRTELHFASKDAPALEVGTSMFNELAASEGPFFLLIHTFEVHDPFDPEEPYDRLFKELPGYETVTMIDLLRENEKERPDPERVDAFRLRYDQGIAEEDERIATFLESIPEETLENTVIILTADHGEAFGEHGQVWHAQSLHQEELHIPLMMRVPGAQRQRIDTPVSLLDLAPTILELADTPFPGGFTGMSLVPLMEGHYFRDRVIPLVDGMPSYFRTLTSETVGTAAPSLKEAGVEGKHEAVIEIESYGIRHGSEKVFIIPSPTGTDQIRWYDLATDPEERFELSGNDPSLLPLLYQDALGIR